MSLVAPPYSAYSACTLHLAGCVYLEIDMTVVTVISHMTILYMYYDATRIEGELTLNMWHDEAYDTNLRECCLPPIV